MKKFKLVALVCLLCLVAVSLIACGGNTETTKSDGTTAPIEETTLEETTETTEITTTAEVTTEEPEPLQFASVMLGDVPLSEYTIIYARSEYYNYSRLAGYRDTFEVLFPVWDFDHETADRLSDLIFEVTGIRLAVAEDKSTTATDHEILIGETSRSRGLSLDIDALASDDYTIKMVQGKLAIYGGECGTTWHAIDYLETMFAEKLAANELNLTFDADYSYSGQHHLVRIGCIGDSITEGWGLTNGIYSYVSQLSRAMWKDAIFYNFGSSGATMRSDLADAYTARQVYTNALNTAADIDIFTIMLGTNDSNRDRSWSTADTELFNNSCLNIVKALTQKNQNLEFVIMNCPAYFGSENFGSANIRNIQKSLPDLLNNAGYPTTFFDMLNVTKSLRANYPDLLHPDADGHLVMANALKEYLQTLVTPTETEAE